MSEQHKQRFRVVLVVDRRFGERLESLPAGVPVWIVDTPENGSVARRLWKQRPQETHLTGITTFSFRPDSSSEDDVLDHLDSIDLHHGPLSANPPYSALEVVGTKLTARVRSALMTYGFTDFQLTPEGFVAAR